tara:strand:- start:75 stop:698 length:624 start_codon:yes stop_codon:yes gene_type:complete
MYDYEEQKATLKEIHELLSSNGFLDKMHLSIGTLLGAIRQKKLNTFSSFNNWDDLDFSVNQQNFKEFKDIVVPELMKIGFHIQFVWMTSFGEVGEVTFYRGKDRLDVNQVFPHENEDGKYYLHCHWVGNTQLTKGLSAEYYEDIRPIELEGLEFYGPKNTDQYLIDCYGPDWRIPTKSMDEYKYWEDSPGLPWWDRTTYRRTLTEIE